MIRYSERQNPDIWVYVLICGVALVACFTVVEADRHGWPAVTPPLALLALLMYLMTMRTTVDSDTLSVTFGRYLTWYRWRIPLSKIASSEVVAYSPIKEYGGWGIRGFGKRRALNMRGNRGVQLVLQSGDRILIGSGQPEKLYSALQIG